MATLLWPGRLHQMNRGAAVKGVQGELVKPPAQSSPAFPARCDEARG